MGEQEKVLLSWSGGKESLMMLNLLRSSKDFKIAGLLTLVWNEDDKVTMRGISRELMTAQALALGLNLEVVSIPKSKGRQFYDDQLTASLEAYRDAGVRKVAFGDIFLDDLRDMREDCLGALGMEALFPLWQVDTRDLSATFINQKYRALVTCIHQVSMPSSLIGCVYDRAFLNELPLEVDPCGENGEFHTFVVDGPGFGEPVSVSLGREYQEDDRLLCELTYKFRKPSLSLRSAL